MNMASPRIVVAIPAHDEAERIGACLDALAGQRGAAAFSIVVLANNCRDETAPIARAPRGLDIRVIEQDFAPPHRSAGHARSAAMEQAANFGEILLTTDADCVPDQDWVQQHSDAFARGVDAVAGRVSADWNELRLHAADALQIGALEWEYLGLIGEAEGVFDPRSHDPAPRHAQRCGANIGITSAMLARVGGVPLLPSGEDRALLYAVERIDGLVRQDCGPHVTASARIEGRAAGGMADALAARGSPQYRCDEQFGRADRLAAMWQARRAARAAWSAGAGHVLIDGTAFMLNRAQRFFGIAWAQIMSSAFPHMPLAPAELPREILRMRELIARHE